MASMLAISAMILPSFALAHGVDDSNDSDRKGRGELRAQVLGDNDDNDNNGFKLFGKNFDRNGDHKGRGWAFGLLDSGFYHGTVTAESSSSLTIETKKGSSLTVDADSAKVIQLPNIEAELSDISVGDRVKVTGHKTSDSEIEASVIYFLPAHMKPAKAKGTVTASSSNSLTVETKSGETLNVNTTADTQIVGDDHEELAMADIETGAKVKLFGLWDSLLNVFNAIKIRLM